MRVRAAQCLIPLAVLAAACAASARRSPVAPAGAREGVVRPSAPEPAPRKGLSWGKVAHDDALGIDRVHCYGKPALPEAQGGPGCNPYEGDTPCGQALPILCVKVDGSPRPPYAMSCGSYAMPGEYYCGWVEGRLALTKPVAGLALASAAAADALCAAALGAGWRMAEHHDGKFVMGMGAQSYSGESWRANELARGGWGFFGYGDIDDRSRFWVRIDDQRGNCWDE
jgi:hypothetical protein